MGADEMTALPPGFVLDSAPQVPALPPGFVVDAAPSITDAVTDIPAEIGRTFNSNLDTFKAAGSRGDKGSIEGLMNTGKAVMAVPGMAFSWATGAGRSLIGHPMAQAEHAVGTLIAPDIAAKDDPQKMYEAAAGDAEKSLLAAKPGTASVPKVATPSIAELKTASRAGYNSPEVAAVEVHPQPVANLSAKIENDLAQRGFRPRANQGGPVFEEVRDLVPPQGVASVRVADLHSARKALGEIAKERDLVGQPTSNAAAASIAKQHLDDFLPNIQQADVIAGDAKRAAEIMRDADQNWKAAKQAQMADLQLTRADRQAAKSGSGSNIENAMRQKIAAILDNPRRSSGLSDPVKAKMEEIVRGSVPRNILRKAGKLGVDGGLSLLLHTGGALETGGATLPLAVGGTVARKLGEHLTHRAGRQLSEMIRNESAVARGQKAGTSAVARALTGPSARPRAAIPYAAIVSALMQPQRQGAH